MAQDLTTSKIDRQNILNNPFAVQEMQKHLELGGARWENEIIFTKVQVAELFSVDERTIERYIASHKEELEKNGYRLLKGSNLKKLLEAINAPDINVGSKVTQFSLFSFRAVLNIAMLLAESEKAKQIRSRMLDMVIDIIAKKTGGHAKYINQRDEGYLLADFQQKTYRKKFIEALNKYTEPHGRRNASYTNKIYQAIFQENAKEYREILKLQKKDNTRDTMYEEVLRIIASLENGLAYEIEKESKKLGRKLNTQELNGVFEEFINHPLHEPQILDARTKMASRDLCFRDAFHKKLEQYAQSVPKDDFERFLCEKSKSLEDRVKEAQDVFKRLKDR